jgi:Domain of unknown function (DUF4832)/Domain of unknown function (DUF4874)
LNTVRPSTHLCATFVLAGFLSSCGGSSSPSSQSTASEISSAQATNSLPASSPLSTEAPAQASTAQTASTEFINTSYLPYSGKLQNPDRGFFYTTNLINSTVGGVNAQPNYESLRNQGYSLVRTIVRLDDFRSGSISDAALAQMNASFDSLRQNGLKAQVWFMYNFPSTWDVSNPPPDAPLSVVLNHLDQLGPVFQKNSDVIGGLKRGFIGAWGEGHSSTNGLDQPAAKQAIFDKIQSVFPSTRMVQLRTVSELRATVPKVDASTAHDKSRAARTGLMNACFMVNNTDAGTYLPSDQAQAQKDYLADISKYILVGGETCEVPTTTRRDNCTNAKIELARYHFTYLNDSFYRPTIDSWKAEGCFDEIANKLGYRIELLRSSIAKTTQAGSAFNAQITLKNSGYAAPYNPRGLAIVLRNIETQKIVWLALRKERDKKLDPRMWLPEDGDITLDLAPIIPANTPAGKYQVLLSLHDPIQELSSKPAYSIRTANEGIWEQGSGWNKLTNEIQITTTP